MDGYAGSMRQVEQQILCPYCSKKRHAKRLLEMAKRGGKDDAKRQVQR